MCKVKKTTQFKKDFKLIEKRGYDTTLLFDVIDKLRNGQPCRLISKTTLFKGNSKASGNATSNPIGF